MYRQPSLVLIIRQFAQQVEKLAVHDADDKVEGGVRVRDDDEERRLLLPDALKVHLVVFRKVPQFLDVKWCKACATANKYGFRSLAGA